MGMARRSIITTALAFIYGACHLPAKISNPRPQKIQTQRQAKAPVSTPQKCYYRTPTQGKPFDHHLWQGERSCSESSCAPSSPELKMEQISQVSEPAKIDLLAQKGEIKALLKEAEKDGSLVWLSDSNQELYRQLDAEVRTAPEAADVHFVIGIDHLARGQNEFGRQLFRGWSGADSFAFKHLVLEMDRFTSNGVDIQSYIDRYLVHGREADWPVFYAKPIPATGRQIVAPAEVRARELMARTAVAECYDLILGDAKAQVRGTGLDLFSVYAARERHMVGSMRLRDNPHQPDLFVTWIGAVHAASDRLPYYIEAGFPNAKVVSLVINGGRYKSFSVFDQAIKELGWLERGFVLKLGNKQINWLAGSGYNGVDEAVEYIVHLPTEEKEKGL